MLLLEMISCLRGENTLVLILALVFGRQAQTDLHCQLTKRAAA